MLIHFLILFAKLSLVCQVISGFTLPTSSLFRDFITMADDSLIIAINENSFRSIYVVTIFNC